MSARCIVSLRVHVCCDCVEPTPKLVPREHLAKSGQSSSLNISDGGRIRELQAMLRMRLMLLSLRVFNIGNRPGTGNHP